MIVLNRFKAYDDHFMFLFLDRIKIVIQKLQ